jgi:hypothetical protein
VSVYQGPSSVQRAYLNASSSGDNTFGIAVAGQRIRLISYKVGPVAGAVNYYFKGTTAGRLCSTKYLATNQGDGRALDPNGCGVADAASGDDIIINLSGAVNVGVDIEYLLF